MYLNEDLKREVQKTVTTHLENRSPALIAMLDNVRAVEMKHPQVSRLCPLNTFRLSALQKR